MNIGSLYQVKKYFWLLFPTKEIMITAVVHVINELSATLDALVAADDAAWYSRKYNCNVTYFSHDTFVVFLEEDGKFKKVLTSEGLIGWAWFGESYNESFEEIKP